MEDWFTLLEDEVMTVCGRYFFQLQDQLGQTDGLRQKLEQLNLFTFRQGEVFPSQQALVLCKDGMHDYQPRVMKWGLPVKGRLLINARSEGIAEKYTFRPMLKQRCVITANGFYEWVKHGSGKDKIYIQKKDEPRFYMAGIYNDHEEFVIVTGASANEMARVHHRTPIMMNEQEMLEYLHDERDFLVENEGLLFQKV